MAWLLQQDEELQEVLSDALMRSEQHRENYLRFLGFNFDPNSNSLGRLKSQLEVALHQHKALEGELERSRVEAEDQVPYDGNCNGNDDDFDGNDAAK